MDIEKAKEVYVELKKNAFIVESIDKNFFLKFGETVLNELDKKDKIINEMANNIADSSNVYENLVNTEFQHTTQEVIDYFTKKVEGK